MRDNDHDYTHGLSPLQRLGYHLLYSLLWFSALLPLRMLYAINGVFYLLLYRVVRYRRQMVRRNLRESFPDMSPLELRQTEQRFYHWMCDSIAETTHLARATREEMSQRVVYHNLECLDRLIAEGRSVVLYLGHYCNWEWMTTISLHIDMQRIVGGQVYHALENKVVDRVMLRLRSRLGTECVEMRSILRRIATLRREGKQCVFGFISDQTPTYSNTHYWTTLLNHPDTLVITGTERIARQANMACIYLDVSRPRRGTYEVTLVPMTDKPQAEPQWGITEQYIRLLEQTIRRQPHLWLWTHNRWKRTLQGLRLYQQQHARTL